MNTIPDVIANALTPPFVKYPRFSKTAPRILSTWQPIHPIIQVITERYNPSVISELEFVAYQAKKVKNPIIEEPNKAAFCPVVENPPFSPASHGFRVVIILTLSSRHPISLANVSAAATATAALNIQIPNSQSLLIYSFISIASVLLIIQDGNHAVYNLKNTESLFEDYPLRKLSQEIDMQFQNDYTVLALDHTLILYYLDKPNYTYIIHPSNHAEDYIVKTLASLGKINENYLEEILLYQDPDVILCSARMIVKGNPTKNTLFNCAVDDYRKEYIKLDTTNYEQNLNLSYYVDPYREINVYIKKPADS